MPPIFLTVDEVVEIHRDQIERYGGSVGVRDMALLQSAVAMPQTSFGGKYLHTDLFEMAAAYLFHIVRNHPLVDGNKRVGTVAALVSLALNGKAVQVTNTALAKTILSVARGEIGKSGIAEFLRKRSRR